MGLRSYLLVLVLAALAGGCSLSQKMTVPKTVGACRTFAMGECDPRYRNAICDQYGDVLYTAHPGEAECRQACQAVQLRWLATMQGLSCRNVLSRGASLCMQYCTGLYGEGGSGEPPPRESGRPAETKEPGIPEESK